MLPANEQLYCFMASLNYIASYRQNPITQKSVSLLARLMKREFFHRGRDIEVQLH